jgi:hypothetical protein
LYDGSPSGWSMDVMQQDYYAILTSLIAASAANNPEARRRVYELARYELRRRLSSGAKEFGQFDEAQHLRAFETAIERIEADLGGNPAEREHGGANLVTAVADSAVEIIPPAGHEPVPPQSPRAFSPERASRKASPAIWSVFPLVGAAVLGVATYVAVERGVREQPKLQSDQNISDKSTSPQSVALPLPVAYGVYAVADGRLTELEPLSIKVIGHGIALSGVISTASKAKLPNGRIQFIIFKRELVNNAPEKIIVRTVAPVARAQSLREGETVSNQNGSWAIGNTSYQMKVAPIGGGGGMIVIRPADSKFSFPTGRYALVLNRLAYDFSVAGP